MAMVRVAPVTVQVRTDTNVVVGTGTVTVQNVTP